MSLAILLAASCGGELPASGVDGTDAEVRSTVASISVPIGIQCVRLKLSGTRSRSISQAVSYGQTATVDLGHLPVGPYTLTAEAFGVACPASGEVLYSGAASFAVAQGADLRIELPLLRNANVTTTLDFEPVITKLVSNGVAVMALNQEGWVYAWGRVGPLVGPAAETTALRPNLMTYYVGVVDLALGSAHYCYIWRAGEVLCGGQPDHGALGAPLIAYYAPVNVPLPRPALKISARDHRTCALLDDYSLWCWGAGSAMGACAEQQPCAPAQVYTNPPSTADVAVGLNGVVFRLDTSGNVLFDGLVGTYGPIEPVWVDRVRTLLPGRAPCALRADGSVYCPYPTHSTDLSALQGALAAASSGYYRDCGLLEEGIVACQGSEPGNGFAFSETFVTVLSDATAIVVESDFSCAALRTGGVSCWGMNWAGQGGTGDVARSYTPRAVKF